MRRESRARLELSLVAEPGDARLRDLLRSAGSAQALLAAVREGVPVDGRALPEAWGHAAARLDARLERAIERAADAGLRWVAPGDPSWPGQVDDLDQVDSLQGSTGTPLGLWIRGEVSLGVVAQRALAVVGARTATAYGAAQASEHAADLGDAGFTIISGAAYGIDAAAHRGALAVGAPTVAVLACGADADYPRGHASLLDRIVGTGGLVVSEQAPGAEPLRSRFLSRNRIIAALAEGTLVVEAARRSGSLNTLHWADRLGRITMGLPGPVTSAQSDGVHQAVRDGKAVLVGSSRHVMAELGVQLSDDPDAPDPDSAYDRLPVVARRALDALAWDSTASVGEVADRAGLTAEEASAAVTVLRGRGLATCADGRWLLTRRADSA